MDPANAAERTTLPYARRRRWPIWLRLVVVALVVAGLAAAVVSYPRVKARVQATLLERRVIHWKTMKGPISALEAPPFAAEADAAWATLAEQLERPLAERAAAMAHGNPRLTDEVLQLGDTARQRMFALDRKRAEHGLVNTPLLNATQTRRLLDEAREDVMVPPGFNRPTQGATIIGWADDPFLPLLRHAAPLPAAEWRARLAEVEAGVLPRPALQAYATATAAAASAADEPAAAELLLAIDGVHDVGFDPPAALTATLRGRDFDPAGHVPELLLELIERPRSAGAGNPWTAGVGRYLLSPTGRPLLDTREAGRVADRWLAHGTTTAAVRALLDGDPVPAARLDEVRNAAFWEMTLRADAQDREQWARLIAEMDARLAAE